MNEYEIDQLIEDLERYKELLDESTDIKERKFFSAGIKHIETLLESCQEEDTTTKN